MWESLDKIVMVVSNKEDEVGLKYNSTGQKMTMADYEGASF